MDLGDDDERASGRRLDFEWVRRRRIRAANGKSMSFLRATSEKEGAEGPSDNSSARAGVSRTRAG